MPQSLNITDVPQPVLGADQEYKERTGREIYEELSITGLNRSPIETLNAFTTADSEITSSGASIWPEIPLAEICEYILVDGSFVIRYIGEEFDPELGYIPDKPYVFLKDCVEIHYRFIVQPLRNERGVLTGITRVYTKGDTSWLVQNIKGYGSSNPQVVETVNYPLEYIVAYPYGKGLLFYNQKTFRRLEEIEEGVRANTGPAALSLIVTGYAGDWKRAQDTFAKGAKIIGIPGSATVTRVAANNTTSDLLQDKNGLLRDYTHNMHLIEVSEASNMSGKSRIIAMKPMLNYVTTIRTVMDEVYALLGYEVTWGGLDVTDTSEKIAELDFLERGKKALLLSIQEFMRMARALFGLKGEPEGDLEEPEPEPEIVPDENMNPMNTGETNA